MPRNKKSVIVIETAIRLMIVAVLIVFVFVPACNRVKNFIINSEKKYMESFQSFVDKVNSMKLPSETFSITLEEKSGIIGISKNADTRYTIPYWLSVRISPAMSGARISARFVNVM